LIWTTIWGSRSVDRCNDIDIDWEAGVIYMAGDTAGTFDSQKSAGSQDAFITQLNIANGKRIWTKFIGSSGRDSAVSVSRGPNADQIFLIGHCSGSIAGQRYSSGMDIFVSRLMMNGSFAWTRMFGTAGDDIVSAGHWASRTNLVHIAGGTSGLFPGNDMFGRQDAFLMQITTDGLLKWTLQWGTDVDDTVSDFAFLPDAQIVYVAGNTGGALDGLEGYGSNDIYLSKISVDGAYIESERWGTSSYDFAQNMDSDLVYNYIYLTGQYGSAAVLGQYQSGLPFNYSAAPIVQRGQTFSNDSLIKITFSRVPLAI
jgi:hypothetical protein